MAPCFHPCFPVLSRDFYENNYFCPQLCPWFSVISVKMALGRLLSAVLSVISVIFRFRKWGKPCSGVTLYRQTWDWEGSETWRAFWSGIICKAFQIQKNTGSFSAEFVTSISSGQKPNFGKIPQMGNPVFVLYFVLNVPPTLLFFSERGEPPEGMRTHLHLFFAAGLIMADLRVEIKQQMPADFAWMEQWIVKPRCKLSDVDW